MTKAKHQTQITMYFCKVTSASSLISSATPETARPTPSLPPPPQLTQDEEDEDLYGDPLPFTDQ